MSILVYRHGTVSANQINVTPVYRPAVRNCCNWQGLSPVLMPLTGLAPASPYFGLRAMGRLSFPK